MFAAHQGYGLQSELSRVRLQSRVLGPEAVRAAAAAAVEGELAAAAAATDKPSSAAVAGLRLVMQASRSVGEEESSKRGRGRPRTPAPEPQLAPAYPGLFGSAQPHSGGQLPVLPGLTVAMASPHELQMCLSESTKQVLRSDAAVLDDDLSEELADAAAAQQDWEMQQAAAASGGAAAARAIGLGDSSLAPPGARPRNYYYEDLKPPRPMVPFEIAMERLSEVEGVDVSIVVSGLPGQTCKQHRCTAELHR